MNRVFGLGSAAIDFRICVADLGWDYPDKRIAQKTMIYGGGSMANCLTQIARLGGDAVWLGKLGRDWIGMRILDLMREEHIDLNQVILDASFCSPFNIAVYAGEEGAAHRIGGFLLPNSLVMLTEQDLLTWASNISRRDWVALEFGELPASILVQFVRLLKQTCAGIVLDVDLDPLRQCQADPDLIDELFSAVDYLMPNRAAINSMMQTSAAPAQVRYLIEKYQTAVVMTAGAEGAYAGSPQGEIVHVPAESVHVVDTVGAGDAFHGGFLYALAQGGDWREALKLGAYCGSMNCLAQGPRSGMPRSGDPVIAGLYQTILTKRSVSYDD